MDRSNEKTERIAFSGSLTIRNAEAVRERLTAALAEGGRVVVDCTEAKEVDITFIQLLIAARRSAAQAGGDLVLARAAEGALLEALQRGGYHIDGRNQTDSGVFWSMGAA